MAKKSRRRDPVGPRAHPESPLPPATLDLAGQHSPEQIDRAIPAPGYRDTPMVGLGGSAGSVSALTEFFRVMPADTGMVFVVIMHLSPTHESSMAELLGRTTKMPVVAAFDGQKVEANHVYVIPPGKLLAASDGHLRLTDLGTDRGKRVAVDLFFRSLADACGPHAAAVVLSGADGDGALGIKRIKERGGLTIAQDPEEAQYPSMPRSAIDTSMVDFVLKVGEMPDKLIEYQRYGARLRLPSDEAPPAPRTAQQVTDAGEAALRDVLALLRLRTKRDFSYYKRATILRRIARRMQVNGVEDLPSYLALLRTHSGEAGALFQDLLISVTNFFRDRDSFTSLQAHIPALFHEKTSNDTVRVWIPGCATGEEAYSVAMLLLEHARTLAEAPALQVFASDLNDEAIQTARAGQYSDAIAADVSEERLRQFFVQNHASYHVRREVREMVLFAQHDLLRDAPFSRMDLISCRNLLIYLDHDAQRRAMETFHFALRRDGILFLGSSESTDDDKSLFRPIDAKHRIYKRRHTERAGFPISSEAVTLENLASGGGRSRDRPVVHGARFAQDAATTQFRGAIDATASRGTLAELHFKLLERYAPPSVIVDADHEIVHLSEHAGGLLNFIGGEPTANILRIVHPALRVALRSALFRAVEGNMPAESMPVTATIGPELRSVRIRISPANEIAKGFLLILFDMQPAEEGSHSRSVSGVHEPVVQQLERELELLKVTLRDTVEQFEASTEELKASNEELQAMNEELRSATEELETSREELQSMNEELTTVNQEMTGKVNELARINSDVQNLMASTEIATVFLDRELAVTRYTPAAAGIFYLIPGDIGRPLAHLRHELDYPNLIADIEQVSGAMLPFEREVRGGRRSYLARIQPYRTSEDLIGGTVLTFVDVTERNEAIEALLKSEERMRVLIESVKEYAIFTTDADQRIDSWNAAAETMFGYTEAEILTHQAGELFTPEDRVTGDPGREVAHSSDDGSARSERWHIRKDGSRFYGSGVIMPLRGSAGTRGFVKIIRDLTTSKRTDDTLREQMADLVEFNSAAIGRELRMIEIKKEYNALAVRHGEAAKYALDEDVNEGSGGGR